MLRDKSLLQVKLAKAIDSAIGQWSEECDGEHGFWWPNNFDELAASAVVAMVEAMYESAQVAAESEV